MSRTQIERRAALLLTAEEAARVLRRSLGRDDPREQFMSALAWVGMLAIRYALRQFEVAGKAAAQAGGAPVPNDCAAIYTAVNRINKADWAGLTAEDVA